MKTSLYITLLLGLSASHLYAKPPQQKPTPKATLEVQKSAALPAHLTTRLAWRKFPQPKYKNEDLNQQNRAAIVRIYADETGKISQATIQESTGLKNLDDALLQAVRTAEIQPTYVEDTAVPTIGFQSFNLRLQDNQHENCQFDFQSKQWLAQQQQQKVQFKYRHQPQLNLSAEDLKNHSRKLKFQFKVNKHGEVKRVKLTQGSGQYALDQQVLAAVKAAQVDVPRQFWLYKKSKLKDEIYFDLDTCDVQEQS
ncbi:energy transducer TonB [Acinetobacter towneri]|uniref:energy transducer TonB n=1 Tax=Acinetobacter towneri TaxID=202956 RepID=UPI00293543F3|nr:energy transducer TonB [Acinetobacter towneri]MDV2483432.1 energy transducer TonB [Acinetobacter towneri]